MAEREFRGIWIPAEVWLDERLNALEKIILLEIDSLDKGDDGCWATNEYLGTFCQCSAWKVSTAVSKLVELGYLKVFAFDGRRRKIKSCLSFFKMQTFENPKAEVGKAKEIITTNYHQKESIPRQGADSDSLPGFDEFWAAYPKKEAKKAAMKAWKKLKPNDDLQQTILADIRQRKDGSWKDRERRFIPNPATYLNGARWTDEQAAAEPAPKSNDPYANETPEERERRSEAFDDAERRRLFGDDYDSPERVAAAKARVEELKKKLAAEREKRERRNSFLLDDD